MLTIGKVSIHLVVAVFTLLIRLLGRVFSLLSLFGFVFVGLLSFFFLGVILSLLSFALLTLVLLVLLLLILRILLLFLLLLFFQFFLQSLQLGIVGVFGQSVIYGFQGLIFLGFHIRSGCPVKIIPRRLSLGSPS
ncbi:MAG: hypothetical protein EP311_11075 [Cytophagales bacterium]|nr:MAG: hypothetical protein EP311_11075 [Cytophagales bacterium]